MQFVNSNGNHNMQMNPQGSTQRPMLSFSRKYLNYKARQQPLPETIDSTSTSLSNETKPTKKIMKWGEPTWFLFHTMAHKIKDDSFPILRVEILQHITQICHNLPCPSCAEHATQYLNGINYNTIKTKQQVKDLLFVFHNSVNQRRGVPLFGHEQLDAKYSTASTVNIIQHFMYYYQDKSFSVNMIANDLHRKQIVKRLAEWFNLNLAHFDL